MPNWIEGTLKIRGNLSDIKRFFDEGLDASSYFGEAHQSDIDKQRVFTGNIEEGWIEYTFSDEPHVKGTRRMFITDDYVFADTEDDDLLVCCVDIKQAWSFISNDTDEQKLIEIADEYNVDLRLFGIECGMQFCEEIIVCHGDNGDKGKIVLNKEIQYKDWMWECPFPRMGG